MPAPGKAGDTGDTEDKRRIVATIEARMTSTRLPGKVLKPMMGRPMLELMVERLRHCPSIDEIVIATTTGRTDDPVEELASSLGIGCYRGSEEDVLLRVVEAAEHYGADLIVELTGDCPLIDPDIVEQVIGVYLRGGYDYVSNVLKLTYPDGMDTQVFSTEILREVEQKTSDPADREHVSLYIYEMPGRYRTLNIESGLARKYWDLRLTVDTIEDFKLVEEIFLKLYPDNPSFGLGDIIALLDEDPSLLEINSQIKAKSKR
ncbi:MAG: glycosyltransferase family protein [Thermodesulfovibrionales bacterium]|nr:glycosyltransferase family protein [Thermodesulfovibrionales bacterium]